RGSDPVDQARAAARTLDARADRDRDHETNAGQQIERARDSGPDLRRSQRALRRVARETSMPTGANSGPRRMVQRTATTARSTQGGPASEARGLPGTRDRS